MGTRTVKNSIREQFSALEVKSSFGLLDCDILL